MNRRGMLAMMDAMLFMMLITVALAVTVHMAGAPASDGRDATDMLDSMLSAEVRMSDLAEDGDGSLVRVSDLLALALSGGDDGALGYAEELLEGFSSGRHCRLELRFGGYSAVLGSGDGMPSASASAEVPVSTGGVLRATLSLYPS